MYLACVDVPGKVKVYLKHLNDVMSSRVVLSRSSTE